jgi:hypothetical protein
VRFQVDDHVFVLAQHEGECLLWEETRKGRQERIRLSDKDQHFENRLLVAIGDVVRGTSEAVTQ